MNSSRHVSQQVSLLSTMFERAYDILNERGMQSFFEVLFAVYRNYNVPASKICEHSGWETDPRNLRDFMASIVQAPKSYNIFIRSKPILLCCIPPTSSPIFFGKVTMKPPALSLDRKRISGRALDLGRALC